jgi:hypothetical protein
MISFSFMNIIQLKNKLQTSIPSHLNTNKIHTNNSKLDLTFSISISIRTFSSLFLQFKIPEIVLYFIVSIFKQINKSGPDFCASRLISHNGEQRRREPIQSNRTESNRIELFLLLLILLLSHFYNLRLEYIKSTFQPRLDRFE